ncbi:hypothetical protein PV326_004436, partial [Microctonus aethiopoides]
LWDIERLCCWPRSGLTSFGQRLLNAREYSMVMLEFWNLDRCTLQTGVGRKECGNSKGIPKPATRSVTRRLAPSHFLKNRKLNSVGQVSDRTIETGWKFYNSVTKQSTTFA